MPTRAVIAHISDLHFGNHDKRVGGYLRDDLKRDPKPDFIVVTGDLADRRRPWRTAEASEQFEAAKAYLDDLVKQLSTKEHRPRVIVIPGNHDVGLFKQRADWDLAFAGWEAGGAGSGTPRALVDFHKAESSLDDATSAIRADEDWSHCEYYPEHQLAFLKFDSNRLAPGVWNRLYFPWIVRNYARGRVGNDQIDDMKRVLDRYEKAFPVGTNEPAFADARKIALVHHHIHYLPNVGSDSIFLMVDAGRFWKAMIDSGVDLVLHGHKHFATHVVLRYTKRAEYGSEQRELMVVSAGTALSKDRPDGKNSYYRIEADFLSCRVQQRSLIDTHFESVGPSIVFRTNVDVRIPGATSPIDAAVLDAMLTPDEVDYVHEHAIDILEYLGTIDRELGYTMEITCTGKHLSYEPYLNVPMAAINKSARDGALAPTVMDLLAEPNKPIKGVKLDRHPSNGRKLLIKVPLPGANKGSPFKIYLKVYTPQMMYDANDFDAVGLLRFQHGPASFTYALRSERQFLGVRCFRVHRTGLWPLDVRGAPRDADGLYVVRPQIGPPATLGCGVLCHFDELLPATAPADVRA